MCHRPPRLPTLLGRCASQGLAANVKSLSSPHEIGASSLSLEAHRARVIKMLDVDSVAELVRFADRWVQGLSPR
ncbi:hypothetical protein MVI01_51740 [Myxococcus virescens]|uniref:HTH luxR-type domain-containing protein n=1 Tax=Myxococcus virescens TaxID=83456 RepID=A0A511HIJ1_9BACT|nr:hypothetical protein MVI01_51740 [Myxococcus virescens]SDE88591.1 hypothetical protein SAMN04488504_11434 [Myxococcus virescens]